MNRLRGKGATGFSSLVVFLPKLVLRVLVGFCVRVGRVVEGL